MCSGTYNLHCKGVFLFKTLDLGLVLCGYILKVDPNGRAGSLMLLCLLPCLSEQSLGLVLGVVVSPLEGIGVLQRWPCLFFKHGTVPLSTPSKP